MVDRQSEVMKQHITIEQLNELSEKAKKKLGKKWVLQEGDKYGGYWTVDGLREGIMQMDDDGELCPQGGVWLLPLLSIGQMIEFLGNGWWTKVNSLGEINDLCDALWEAVK